MKKYLWLQAAVGLVASVLMDYYAQNSQTSSEQQIAMVALMDSLKSTLPTIAGALIWGMISYLIAKKFFGFSNELDGKGSEFDRAFALGLIMNAASLFVYLAFYYLVDSPVRLLSGL
ncbi:hypothetical protein PPW95_25200 (plasmid) [Vibrio parahaemolyticus]|uniref:hypothetical protein n=1 Tax=Vibrio harveyi group TaxID=717610 RepID=UPI00097196A5|nr:MULTISPECIES: hypothetical protein [Vibrio harveyi group]APX10036.1 hypothetical protein BWP24_28010 [Vibrio campbellii]WCP78908.1 hypothetical protein PPW95_25200 [Vibrio parahaemolyticus]